MQIDRNNYEEWLLRYLDGELSQAECAAVEAYAAQHADVQEELLQLKATLLPAEAPAPMPHKLALYKATLWDADQLSTLQEKMLLLADDALPPAEKEALLFNIAAKPALQKDWALLQQARLLPEAIPAMPGKAILYRQSRGAALLTIRRTLQWAAAAMVAGMGLWAAWQYSLGLPGTATSVSSTTTAPTEAVQAPAVAGPTAPTAVQAPEQGTYTAATAPVAGTNHLAGGRVQATQGSPAGTAGAAKGTTTTSRQVPTYAISTLQDNAAQPAYQLAVADVPQPEAALKQPLSRPTATSTLPAAKVALNGGTEATFAGPAVQSLAPDARLLALQATESSTSTTEEAGYSLAIAFSPPGKDDDVEDSNISIAGLRIPRQKLRGAYRTITRPIARLFDKPADGEVAIR
jgi:hypothetical protein